MSFKAMIDDIEIPSYSHKQEMFNAISHGLGLLLAIFLMVFGIVQYSNSNISLFYLVGLLIFAISAFLVYLVSTLYHYFNPLSFRKKLFRVIDHCTIYLLIAGTYTPICFVIMQTHVIGLIMVIIQWVGALIGIVLNAFFFKYKWARIISFILYVGMGWLCLYCGGFLYMPMISFAFVLAGGITYTIGSILYALGKKNLNFHSIFHVFVLVSTILQSVGVLLLFV